MKQGFIERFLPLDENHQVFDDPIKRLLIAILERALLDLSDHRVIAYEFHVDGSPIKYRDLVFKWLLSDKDHDPHSFTFLQICSEVGLDPEAARREILSSQYKDMQPTKSNRYGALRGTTRQFNRTVNRVSRG